MHAADLHQSAGTLLDTLGGIDDHQRSIHGRERPVGILGKILVARRVHQVDDAAAIGKLHHRCRHRDATLPFDGHPVGGDAALRLAPLHRACKLDGATQQQQAFGQGGLAGIGMGDDGDGAPGSNGLQAILVVCFFLECIHEVTSSSKPATQKNRLGQGGFIIRRDGRKTKSCIQTPCSRHGGQRIQHHLGKPHGSSILQ